MYIIVVGAGEVGSYVAHRLSHEDHDVALVERNRARAAELEGQLDALVVYGSGTDPDTLVHVGAKRADLIVAVTSDDETNIVSAMLAKHLGATRSIVRVEHRRLRETIAKDLADSTAIDLLIDPDEETAAEIIQLVENPGAIEVESMADDQILVIAVRLGADAPVVGHTLEELGTAYSPKWPFLFATITRAGHTVIPRGAHRLEKGDLVRIVCTHDARPELSEILGLGRTAPRRALLLGGGRTAQLLAATLVHHIRHVVVVERDADRAAELAVMLDSVEVLLGDITDPDFLTGMELGPSDIVVALTGDDDANVLASLYAKSAGVTETIALAHRLSLLPLLAQAGVDGALSPRTATANAVLRFVRGRVTAVATSLRDDIELLEFEIHPDSTAAGRTIAELHLPKEALIGAVLSASHADIGRGSTLLEPHDRIVLIAKPSALDAAKRLFG